MKATIEIDATPEEMRALLGLPDVAPIQQEMLQKIRDKMLAGIETTDPVELMKLFMPTADQFKSLESLQTSFWQAFGKGMDVSGEKKDK